MIDEQRLRDEYDEQVRRFGRPVVSTGLYDRRVLIPRPLVPQFAESHSGERLSLDRIDEMERDGLFVWLGAADDARDPAGERVEQGVPQYVAARIGLFARLRRAGWDAAELREAAEFEEWLIDDCVEAGELPYDDDDGSVVTRATRFWMRQIDDELTGRLPPGERPAGWFRETGGGHLGAKSEEELRAIRERMQRYVARLGRGTLAAESPEFRHRVGRDAYVIRQRDEFIRLLCIHSERVKLEAGFSTAVCLEGERVFPLPDPDDSDDLEAFGTIDWARTLKHSGFCEDPDHYAIRVPGVVLRGGRITLDGALAPADYARRYELFRLPEYVRVFSALVGDRRCAHCERLLSPSRARACLYCSPACGAAARQKRLRERQKANVLRFRSAGAE